MNLLNFFTRLSRRHLLSSISILAFTSSTVLPEKSSAQATSVSGAPCDVDGDGRSDFIIERNSESQTKVWYISSSRGDNTLMPAHYPRVIAGGRQAVRVLLGRTDEIGFVGDVTGDGRVDLMSYNPSTGEVSVLFSDYYAVVKVRLDLTHGKPFVVDLDRDRLMDIAIVVPATGQIGVRQGSNGRTRLSSQPLVSRVGNTAVNTPFAFVGSVQANLSADSLGFLSASYNFAGLSMRRFGGSAGIRFPFHGSHGFLWDANGDGLLDSVSYDNRSGEWAIMSYLESSQRIIASASWGLPFDDVPLCADWDGDGIMDFSVWRRSTGTFFVLFSRGQAIPGWVRHGAGWSCQFGLSTDRVQNSIGQ